MGWFNTSDTKVRLRMFANPNTTNAAGRDGARWTIWKTQKLIKTDEGMATHITALYDGLAFMYVSSDTATIEHSIPHR